MLNKFLRAITSIDSILLFLFFSGLIFQPIKIFVSSFKVEYAISFCVWGLLCIILILYQFSIHMILLLSIIAIFPSIISGIYLLDSNMTNVVDYFADTTRFIAPFLGFATTIFILDKFSSDSIIRLFICLFSYDLYQLFSSVIYKSVNYFIDGETLVDYRGIGIESTPILITVFMFLYFFRKRSSILLFILFIMSLLVFILAPLLVVSKVGFLLLIVQLIFLIYIIYRHISSNLYIVIFSCLIIIFIPIFMNYLENSKILSRYIEAMQTVGIVAGNRTEGSTSSRMGEIEGVLEGLSGSWQSTLFGKGNGAWISSYHVDKYIKTDTSGISGLDYGNYRDNGKYIHHVHSSVFAILYRNGLVGLIFYFYFFYILLKSILRLLKLGVKKLRYYTRNELFVYAFGLGSSFYVVLGIASIFPSMGIYGSLSWGSKVAMISIAIKLLMNSPQKLSYNLTNRTIG